MRWYWRSLAVIGILVTNLYAAAIRPYAMRWGAVPEELSMSLPGDSQITSAMVVSTRALTIDAPAEDVWPWLAQIGQNRGGFYSYDWLENLFGAGMRNADVIVPEWQWPKPGDRVYHQRDGLYAEISVVDPHRVLPLGGWTFHLKPIDGQTTRLVVRHPSFPITNLGRAVYYYLVFEPSHFVMEMGMMLGLKRLAETYGG